MPNKWKQILLHRFPVGLSMGITVQILANQQRRKGHAAFSGTQRINITLLKDKYHRIINELYGCLCVPNCVATSLLLLDNGNYSVQFSCFSTSSCFSGHDKLLRKGGGEYGLLFTSCTTLNSLTPFWLHLDSSQTLS